MRRKYVIMNFPISEDDLDKFGIEVTESKQSGQKFCSFTYSVEDVLLADREAFEKARAFLDLLFKDTKQIIVREDVQEENSSERASHTSRVVDDRYYFGGVSNV